MAQQTYRENSELSKMTHYTNYTGRVTGTWRVLKRNKLVPLPVRQDVVSSVTRLTDAILVAMEQWTAAHCVFIVETFFKNGIFVVATQRLFHWHFHVPHARVPNHNTIHLWIQNCRSTASTAKKKFLHIQWEHHRTSRLWGRQCLGVLVTRPKNVLLPCIYPIAVYEEYCVMTWTFVYIKW